MPVPTAVPPSGSSPAREMALVASHRRASACAAYPESSWLRRTGVASCRCVRPILTTSSNSAVFLPSVCGELFECGNERFLHRDGGGDVDRAGDDVVGRLLLVHVIVGMDGRFAAALTRGDFVGAGGDDLIDVHIGRGAAAGLKNIDDELVVQFSVDDFVCGLLKQADRAIVQKFELVVHLGGGPLDQSQRGDEPPAETEIGDREIFDGPGGLCAVVSVGRHLHFTHGVAFGTGLIAAHAESPVLCILLAGAYLGGRGEVGSNVNATRK